MANNILPTPLFEKKAKRFIKKFPSLFDELIELEKDLIKNPKMGIDLGANLFKIKLASKSKGKGKSGGFRIITYLIKQTSNGYDINLITIFDKSEEANITKEELLKIVNEIFN
jgi:hypothetical protein